MLIQYVMKARLGVLHVRVCAAQEEHLNRLEVSADSRLCEGNRAPLRRIAQAKGTSDVRDAHRGAVSAQSHAKRYSEIADCVILSHSRPLDEKGHTREQHLGENAPPAVRVPYPAP